LKRTETVIPNVNWVDTILRLLLVKADQCGNCRARTFVFQQCIGINENEKQRDGAEKMAMRSGNKVKGWIGDRQRLDPAECWMTDGLRVAEVAGFFISETVNMSQAALRIQQLREHGIKVSYTHVFVQAVAVALARNPQLHQLVIGDKRYVPRRIDIGLSVSGSSVVAPVMVIEQADRKSLGEIAREVTERAPLLRAENERLLNEIRRYGWFVPFGWMRRWIIRNLMKKMTFRHKGAGTFQLSCLKDVDQFAPLLLATGAILGTGRVCERVVVIDGKPEVRLTALITCCGDHKVWDGVRGAHFVHEVKTILESEQSLTTRT
jgi:pyruvate/2-oxoglutarate dehydrogenase complex dihydrolipoamide acyltransferase (E2) component